MLGAAKASESVPGCGAAEARKSGEELSTCRKSETVRVVEDKIEQARGGGKERREGENERGERRYWGNHKTTARTAKKTEEESKP